MAARKSPLKISFCTVCMNRLHHLRKTLPDNIRKNNGYPYLKHILVDYNSTDGLEDWIKENFFENIQIGRLIYCKTSEPDFFHRAHSRNMAFRLSDDNSLVCNIDADNYTGYNFAGYLNKHFLTHPKSYLSVDYTADNKTYKDAYGRIACSRLDFLTVGGYDEQMSGYGYEDIDFCERLSRYGLIQHFIRDGSYLKSISHTHEERQANESLVNQIHTVYLHFINPFKSEIIYLFNDSTFSMATLLDDQKGFGIPTLAEKKWINGYWNASGGLYILKPNNRHSLEFNKTSEGHLMNSKRAIYYRITNEEFIKELKMTYPILTNHQHYLNNKKLRIIKVNRDNFGCGVIVRNFKEKILLG